MIDLVTIVPSRDRPGTAQDLAAAFADTCAAHSLLAIVVDESDPRGTEYARALDIDLIAVAEEAAPVWAEFTDRAVGVFSTPSHTMVEALNLAAAAFVERLDPFAVGFMGDDHRPRTPGWDRRYLDELRGLGTGLVYGDDLGRGAALPTQAAMTTDIVRELGFVAPPGLTHAHLDSFWRDLGTKADCLRFVPDAIVERLHPCARDDGRLADGVYEAARFEADVARVRALRRNRR